MDSNYVHFHDSNGKLQSLPTNCQGLRSIELEFSKRKKKKKYRKHKREPTSTIRINDNHPADIELVFN